MNMNGILDMGQTYYDNVEVTVTPSEVRNGGPSCTVFITSATFTGNLGGLLGADSQCQMLAEAAGLSGTYRAWLSTADTSPSVRFTQAIVPYPRVDGTLIANDYDDLTDGDITNSITLDENGVDRSSGARLWTGTDSDGSPLGANCSDWTSTDGGGQAENQTATDFRWTADENTPHVPCRNNQRFYCFQQ
jgi:hypothetical protein